MPLNKKLEIGDARIGFRNFSGKEGKYNPPGIRNFCVFLDDDLAEELIKDGWNVRKLKPRDPEDGEQAYLQVRVNFKNNPPKIHLITSRNKTLLQENEINILDWAEIENVDLVIQPYEWKVNGKEGVKAYLRTMYITLVEDSFESKYRDVPDSAASNINIDDDPPWDTSNRRR